MCKVFYFDMKNILGLSILIIVIVGGLLAIPQFRNYLKSQLQRMSQTEVQTEMSGVIKEVDGSSIRVEGMVGTENKVVEFTIMPETVLINGSNTITEEQIKSGQNFQPKFEQIVGQVSDLVPGIIISKIRSKENLIRTNKAIAIKIDYVTLILPTI